jgi:hypothetical protein
MKIAKMVVLSLLPLPLFAGAWTQPRGASYFQLSYWRFSSTSIFDTQQHKVALADGGKFDEKSFFVYFENGLSESVTFVASVPYRDLHYTTPGNRSRSIGWGDVYLGLRYLLGTQGYVSSLQVGLKLATGYEIDPQKLGGAPPLGDGQTDVEFKLLAGKSFLRSAAYVSGDVGYRGRSGTPVDEIPYALEVGVHLGRHALLILQGYGAHGLSSVQAARFNDAQIGLNAEENFTKLAAKMVVRLSGVLAFAVTAEKVVAGKNTAAGQVLAVGFILDK